MAKNARGLIYTICLKALQSGRKYPYEIKKIVNEKTDGTLKLVDSSIYSAMDRLHNKKLVEFEFVDADNGKKRKYFALTQAGLDLINSSNFEWNKKQNLINDIFIDFSEEKQNEELVNENDSLENQTLSEENNVNEITNPQNTLDSKQDLQENISNLDLVNEVNSIISSQNDLDNTPKTNTTKKVNINNKNILNYQGEDLFSEENTKFSNNINENNNLNSNFIKNKGVSQNTDDEIIKNSTTIDENYFERVKQNKLKELNTSKQQTITKTITSSILENKNTFIDNKNSISNNFAEEIEEENVILDEEIEEIEEIFGENLYSPEEQVKVNNTQPLPNNEKILNSYTDINANRFYKENTNINLDSNINVNTNIRQDIPYTKNTENIAQEKLIQKDKFSIQKRSYNNYYNIDNNKNYYRYNVTNLIVYLIFSSLICIELLSFKLFNVYHSKKFTLLCVAILAFILLLLIILTLVFYNKKKFYNPTLFKNLLICFIIFLLISCVFILYNVLTLNNAKLEFNANIYSPIIIFSTIITIPIINSIVTISKKGKTKNAKTR